MEMESAKVLDNGRRIVLDMKRKRAAHCTVHLTKAACIDEHCAVQDALPELSHKRIDSRMNSDGCKRSFKPNVKNSLLQYYSNFMKSGMPQRVLFYENGEWTDFPDGFIGSVKEDFSTKKTAIEVDFRGSPSLLDFLHMIVVDLKTGLQLPIAWIDEVGKCFFPEKYSVSDEFDDCFYSGGRENHPSLYPETNDTHQIELQLEIEVTTDAISKTEECSEGSNNHVKRFKIGRDPKRVKTDCLAQEGSTHATPVLGINEVIADNSPLGSVSPKNLIQGSLLRKMTSDTVIQVFLKGMDPSMCADNIHGIQHNSGYWAQPRLELFEKQVEITRKYRGDANVRYAWLASSKEAVSRILRHGLGFSELPNTKPTYGIGVHLTSLGCSQISASYCDVDEKGTQHMVLCRVILGSMELVHPGSEQSFPSTENFDSGINDLLYPKHYIIWNMNMSTHIFPEYVVSFKRSSSAKGYESESGSKEDGVSSVSSSTCQEQLKPNRCPAGLVGDCHRTSDHVEISRGKNSGINFAGGPPGKNSSIKFAGGPPKSPWMPMDMLFAALEDKVPYSSMKLVYQFYGQFKNSRISKPELVHRMRWAVGDTLLKSTLNALRAKMDSCELKAEQQGHGTSN